MVDLFMEKKLFAYREPNAFDTLRKTLGSGDEKEKIAEWETGYNIRDSFSTLPRATLKADRRHILDVS